MDIWWSYEAVQHAIGSWPVRSHSVWKIGNHGATHVGAGKPPLWSGSSLILYIPAGATGVGNQDAGASDGDGDVVWVSHEDALQYVSGVRS